MFSDPIVLSREAILQRKLARSPRPVTRRPTVSSKPLQIIIEEQESRSRSPSPMPGYQSSSSTASSSPSLKARRRHHNLSPTDIQIARDFVGIGDDGNHSDHEDRLLLVPPSSTRFLGTPSPGPSPDSFRLTFTDRSYTFPHPPIPTPSSSSRHFDSFCSSPTYSSPISSPASSSSGSAGLPLTPSSEDDDFFQLPSPRFNPRRAAIQPLVIEKHLSSTLPTLHTPGKDSLYNSFSLSPYIDSSDDESPYESEPESVESDSEFYGQELSKVVSVAAPSISATSRPESVLIQPPVQSKRESMIISVPGRPSALLDPGFPKARVHRRIPNYPPPPVPTTSPRVRPFSHLPTSPNSPSFREFSTPSPRPPPRNSVPADFAFDYDDNDDSSDLSFAIYDIEIDDGESRGAPSPRSAYSQSSYQPSEWTDYGSPLDTAEFDLDQEYPMMLPLSLPGTPIDLEADIAHGLEELRLRNVVSPPTLPSVLEEPQDIAEAQPVEVFEEYERPRTPPPVSADAWSFSTPSPTPSHHARFSPEEHVLKSKWSSSTLASVREEHERRASSRLKLVFGGSPAKKRSSTGNSKKIPMTPLSPMSFIGGSSKKSSTTKRVSTGRRESDYPPIAAVSGVGVRRRGSVSTISDAGSVETSSSTSSSGLRRKPIPIELFLRQ